MPKPISRIRAYAAAVVAVGLVLGAGLLLWPWLNWSVGPFFVFSVLFAVWYGGMGPGILATLLSAAAINWFFTAPYYSFNFGPDDSTWLVAFVLIAGSVIALIQTRRRTERALWRESESFRVTLSSIGDAVITTGLDGRIAFMNPVAEQLTGWSRADALNRPANALLHMIHEDTREPVPNPIAVVLEEGSSVSLANRTCLVARDGREIPVEDSAAAIRDDEGNLLGAVMVFHDVADRRRQERALRESEERLRFALESADMGIWDWNIVTNDLTWTQKLEPLHGFAAGTFPGTFAAFQDRVHPGDRESMAKAIERTLREGDSYDQEFRVVWPDGSVRWVAGKGQVARDAKGRPIRMVGVGLDVTRRKQVEEDLRGLNDTLEERVAQRTAELVASREALRESEQLYRTIGESIPFGIWVCGPDGGVRYLSQYFLDMVGRPIEELQGFGWLDLLPRENIKNMTLAWNAAVQRGDDWNWEHQIRAADGRYRTVLSRGRPIHDADGRIQSWAGVNLDITDRKLAEEALRRETGFVRLLQRVAVAANEAQSIDEAIRACLEDVCRFTGWPMGHAFLVHDDGSLHPMNLWCKSGSPEWDVFCEATRRLHVTIAEEAFPETVARTAQPTWVHDVAEHTHFRRRQAAREAGLRTAFAFPVLVGRSVGAVLEFFSTERVEPDAQLLEVMGHVGTQIGRVIERTRAREAQAQLLRQTEAAEARFRGLLESAPDSVVITNTDGRIVLVNHQTERLFGYRRGELLGQSVDLLVPERFRATHEGRTIHYLGHPKSRPSGLGRELYGLRSDGEEFPIETSLSPLDTAEGELVMSIIRDVSERKQLEEALRQSERLAAIGQMITGLSHESRNALQRSLACLDLLNRKLQDQPDAQKLLREAQKAQNDLRQVYEEVREYAAPVVLERAPGPIESAWREAWEKLAPAREGRAARLREQVDSVDTVCDFDMFRMQQVFRNLMENSLAACPDPAEIDIKVTEPKTTNGPMIEITVRDNGPGLDPEQEKRIFEPFFTTKAKGTGLGMAIVKRIVESHGGRIFVTHGSPGGFELTILLPRSTT